MTDAANAGGSTPPSFGRGATIGRYVVLGLVGRGAMGEVYAAYDPELDRKVAVKLLRTQGDAGDLSAAEAKSRLLREAQAIARLSHPNVIVVHDVGSFGDRVFVAMEFVDGNTVGYWLLANKRTWKEVLRVFMAAGRGLAAAHASQLVHRDFKVENVMVGRDGQVRVMDFGLARRVTGALPNEAGGLPVVSGAAAASANNARADSAGSLVDEEGLTSTRVLSIGIQPRVTPHLTLLDPDATHEIPESPGPMSPPSGARQSGTQNLTAELTQTGAIIGTPAYMAPEQFNGSPADERSDQFSYCVALYEALYGERPFSGRTVADLSDNVRAGRLRPAPDATRVPGWLRRVVTRGLRTNPAERWPSMDALLNALQKDPSAAWRRWAIVAAAAVGIGGISVAARRQGARESRLTCQVASDRFARVWEPTPLPGTRRAAIAAAFRARGQSYAADALAGAERLLDGYVAAWSSMYTESCEATHMRGEQSAEVLDLRMSCLRDRWNEMRALSDVLVEPNGEVVANAVKAAAALTPVDRCADVRTLRAAVPPPTDPVTRHNVEVLRSKLATAKALQDAGRFAKVLPAVAPLISEARATGYLPVVADALYRLGEVQTRLRRANEASAIFDEAIWTAIAARYDEVAVAASVEQIYLSGYLKQDLPLARRWERQAEAFLARMEGHDILRGWMQNNFGVALESAGFFEEAAAHYRKALALKERALGKTHPDVGLSLTNLASVLTRLGRPEEALELSERGVRIMEETLGPEHSETATQWVNRAEVLNQLARYGEAARDAERALSVWEQEFGLENADLPFILGPLGEARLGMEEPAAAIAPLERGLTIAVAQDVRSEVRALRFALARALWQSGKDRTRALRLGSLAASAAVATATDGGDVRVQESELQRKAAEWVAARERDMKGGYPVAGRFRGSPL